jgi:preprotein translocase subunit SecF
VRTVLVSVAVTLKAWLTMPFNASLINTLNAALFMGLIFGCCHAPIAALKTAHKVYQ